MKQTFMIIGVVILVGLLGLSLLSAQPENEESLRDIVARLDLESKDQLPVGTIIASMINSDTFVENFGSNWVLADGRSSYSDGQNVKFIQVSKYGKIVCSQGSSRDECRVPDLRAMFLRGIDTGRSADDPFRDPDGKREPGSPQIDDFASHDHETTIMIGDQNVDGVDSTRTHSGDHHNEPRRTGLSGGNETRPNNVAVYYYIKINLRNGSGETSEGMRSS
jgi:hypothetical protein